jgi:hypothetical protein
MSKMNTAIVYGFAAGLRDLLPMLLQVPAMIGDVQGLVTDITRMLDEDRDPYPHEWDRLADIRLRLHEAIQATAAPAIAADPVQAGAA